MNARPLLGEVVVALVAALLCGCDAAPPSLSSGSTPTAEGTPAAVEFQFGSSYGSRVAAPNRTGVGLVFNAGGGPVVDRSNPFFKSMGTNGRSCGTCHEAETGMTLTPERLALRFLLTAGTDPVFRTVDGSVSPLADVSTVRARASAYRMLLQKGLIRIGLPILSTAEFELLSVEDPYGFASAKQLSLFRRPLAVINLGFLSTVMWDGRETFKDATRSTGFAPVETDLLDQANAATETHAQALQALSDADRQSIYDFEDQLFGAQIEDARAGRLDAAGARGGPEAMPDQEFYFGINDALGGDPTGKAFDPVAMTLYSAWERYSDDADDSGALGRRVGARDRARAAVARGETLFNTKPIAIRDVGGLNDDLGIAVIPGTCTTCHDAPNAGDHSVPAPLKIGTAEPEPVGGLDVSGLPVYTLRNKVTQETVRTTDPGRALITGKWKDVSRFKGPTLRGVASRAPYFHNGSASSLDEVVSFYDTRFSIGLTAGEKSDLVAFLQTL